MTTSETSESCRKRARSEEDDCDDCLPISKRITKLHIRYEGRVSGEDCLEPLLTDNNNVNGVNCCQPQSSWCDNTSSSIAGHPAYDPGPTTSQQSPTGVIGPAMGPSSPPWQQGQYSPPNIPASSQLINLPGSPVLNNEQSVAPMIGPAGIMPISHNLLSVPGGCNQQELVCTGPDQYDPELSKEDNPHYYQTNQVLYYAHMSRLQRLTSQDSNVPSTFQ